MGDGMTEKEVVIWKNSILGYYVCDRDQRCLDAETGEFLDPNHIDCSYFPTYDAAVNAASKHGYRVFRLSSKNNNLACADMEFVLRSIRCPCSLQVAPHWYIGRSSEFDDWQVFYRSLDASYRLDDECKHHKTFADAQAWITDLSQDQVDRIVATCPE